MNSRGENVLVEALIEDVFAMFDPRSDNCDQFASAEANWENGLTDFEWIEFWASLYSSEIASDFSETPIKQ
jgi:hypothetical protein